MRLFECRSYNPFAWNTADPAIVIDVETSVKNRGPSAIGGSKASPHCPNNNIVMCGVLVATMGTVNSTYVQIFEGDALKGFINGLGNLYRSNKITLIGHNIKFDLLYLLKHIDKHGGSIQNFMKNLMVWDTMVVDYLLSGQQHRVSSLDSLCEKLSIPLKDSKIKAYWDAGVDTEDIPTAELEPYLKQDVLNTYSVYIDQYVKAVEMRVIPLLMDQMNLLLATTLMEYNGMYVNIKTFAKDMGEVLEKVNALEERLYEIAENINPDSPTQLSAHLYGGKLSKEVDEPVLDSVGNPCYYKSGIKKGLLKTRKVKKEVEVLTSLPDVIINNIESKDTSEDTLRKILDLSKTYSVYTWIVEYLSILLEYRELSKEYKTYYVGVGNLVWPHDDCIHGNLNMAVTATGRLASSAPNMQNMPGYTED